MDRPSIVVDYDVFYTNAETEPGLEPGWYFWFLDQYNSIVSEPIGPWASADEAMRSGKIAVNVYYDEE